MLLNQRDIAFYHHSGKEKSLGPIQGKVSTFMGDPEIKMEE